MCVCIRVVCLLRCCKLVVVRICVNDVRCVISLAFRVPCTICKRSNHVRQADRRVQPTSVRTQAERTDGRMGENGQVKCAFVFWDGDDVSRTRARNGRSVRSRGVVDRHSTGLHSGLVVIFRRDRGRSGRK